MRTPKRLLPSIAVFGPIAAIAICSSAEEKAFQQAIDGFESQYPNINCLNEEGKR